MPFGYVEVGMGAKNPKGSFWGRYCVLQSWPDYSDPTVDAHLKIDITSEIGYKKENSRTKIIFVF